MRAAPEIQCNHLTIGWGHGIGTYAEDLAEHATDRHQESAGRALHLDTLSHRGVGATVAVVPALGSLITPGDGKHALSAQADLPTARQMSLFGFPERIPFGVPRNQSRIVNRCGQDVTDTEVAGLQSFAPRHPRRSKNRIRSGKEHDIVDGHMLRPRCARQRDCPAPSDVGRVGAQKQVRGNEFVFHEHLEVFPDDSSPGLSDDGRKGDVLSLCQARIERDFGCHGTIVAHRNAHPPAGYRQAMARTRSLMVIALVLPLALLGCTKPNPGITVVSGDTSAHRLAICWTFEREQLEPGMCAQDIVTEAISGERVARIPVAPGKTVGISVDPVVADAGWTPVIGNQRLTSTPITDLYFRFAYPELQEVPADGLDLQIVAGQGSQTKGIWVFKLVPENA